MDQQNNFDQCIEESANKCLSSSFFSSLASDQKVLMLDKIKEHFYNIILTKTIDNLTDQQLVSIKDLEPQDPILEQKLEQFSAELPSLAQLIQEKIDKDSQYIQQNSQLPS